MGSVCASKFHQIPTTLSVDAYYGALHVSHQDWVFKTQFLFSFTENSCFLMVWIFSLL